jgi:SnoaL-like domain
MSTKLPAPIAAYFAAEGTDDAAAFTRCFSHDAVVLDEGRTIEGIAAIKAWKADARAKYRHSTEVIAAADKGGKTVVRGLVSGNFPGSPVELNFAFGLEGGRIKSLEIHP